MKTKAIEIMTSKWYVLHTNEEVVVRSIESSWYEDRNEVKNIAEIEFVNDNPVIQALRLCGATSTVDYTELSYTGHPTPSRQVWKAIVDMNRCLCTVPFGTKAAEVLFGKK